MADSKYFFKRINKIMEERSSDKFVIDSFSFKDRKEYIDKLMNYLGGFMIWGERNFIVYSGFFGKRNYIGRFSPQYGESSKIDGIISDIDGEYPDFNLDHRIQENIGTNKIDNEWRKFFYNLLKDSHLSLNNSFIIASRYDSGENCRVIVYH